MNILRQIDSFGVQYKPKLENGQTTHKTILGGIVTVTVYTVSLIYFVYMMVLWGDNQIMAKQSSHTKMLNYSEFETNDSNLFELSYWMQQEGQIDPFKETGNILTPLLYTFLNGQQSDPISLLKKENMQMFDGKMYMTVKTSNLSLVQNTNFFLEIDGQKPRQEILIVLARCEPKLLTGEQTCASEVEISQFFNRQVNFINIDTKVKQYNLITQEIEFVQQSIYLPLAQDTSIQGQMMLKQMNVIVDDGWLLQSYQQHSFINDANLVMSNVNPNFWQPSLKIDNYFNLFLRLDKNTQEIYITYPKISEIFAQVGSIVSILLLSRYIVTLYNDYVLNEKVINRIIQFYCPEAIQPDSLGRKKNTELYHKLVKQAQQKLTLTNIIYEVSRLTFVLQQIHGRQILQQSHLIQIQLKRNSQEIADSKEIKEIGNIEYHINDMNIVSIPIKPEKLSHSRVQSIPIQYQSIPL